jgi:hypothetical protein
MRAPDVSITTLAFLLKYRQCFTTDKRNQPSDGHLQTERPEHRWYWNDYETKTISVTRRFELAD